MLSHQERLNSYSIFYSSTINVLIMLTSLFFSSAFKANISSLSSISSIISTISVLFLIPSNADFNYMKATSWYFLSYKALSLKLFFYLFIVPCKYFLLTRQIIFSEIFFCTSFSKICSSWWCTFPYVLHYFLTKGILLGSFFFSLEGIL